MKNELQTQNDVPAEVSDDLLTLMGAIDDRYSLTAEEVPKLTDDELRAVPTVLELLTVYQNTKVPASFRMSRVELTSYVHYALAGRRVSSGLGIVAAEEGVRKPLSERQRVHLEGLRRRNSENAAKLRQLRAEGKLPD